VRISHAFQRVTEVGRDFLDYFELTDGVLGLYLGDVSGKGLPAAMYAALVVGTLRGVHKTGLCPSQVLSTLHRRLIIRGMQRDVRSAHADDEDYVRGDVGALSSDDEGLPSA
jgi:serine phosphatase RsbU (regulator of sigma subunit)